MVISRLKQSENVSSGIDTFFKRKRFKEKSDKVIERTINLLNHYLNEYEHNLKKSNENKQSAIRFHTLGKVKSQRNSKHTSAQSDAISYFYESRDLLIQILQSRQGPKNSSL